MAYKSILVEIDESEGCIARIDYALELARQFEAHVTGLAQTYPINIPYHSVSGMKAEIEAMHSATERKRAHAAVEQFKQRAARAGINSVSTRIEMGDSASLMTLHARYHDLIVVGQVEPEKYLSRPDPKAAMDQWVVSAGRPVLVVPYIGARTAQPRRAVIAWDGGREATRAVTDALPLLKRAKETVVLIVDPKKTGNHGQEPGADIGTFLARHGVKVNVRVESAGELDTGTFLLSRLADLEADFLVMGAYGHSRLRELILGGVTRMVLDSMTVPVLFSH